MSKLEQEVDRGAHAARLLGDPLLAEAFKAVEQAIHDKWAESPIRDVEGQIALRHMLNHLRDVKTVLEMAVVDGHEAVKELKRLNEKVISPKQFFGR